MRLRRVAGGRQKIIQEGGRRKERGREEGRGTGAGSQRQLVSAKKPVRLRRGGKAAQRSHSKTIHPPLVSRPKLDVPVRAEPCCCRKTRVYSTAVIIRAGFPSAPLLLLSESLQSQTERCAGDVTAWAGAMRCRGSFAYPGSDWLPAMTGRARSYRHAHLFVPSLALCLFPGSRCSGRLAGSGAVHAFITHHMCSFPEDLGPLPLQSAFSFFLFNLTAQ